MCLPGGAFLGVPPAPMLNMLPAPAAAAGAAAAATPGYPGGAAGIPPNEAAPKDGGAAGCCCPGWTPGLPKVKLAGVLFVFCIVLP